MSEEKASRHRRNLKKILVKKYFRRADEGHKRKMEVGFRPRTKIIQKPQERKDEIIERQPKDLERLCVRKIYSVLKQYQVDRNEAKLLSVQAVKRLQ